MRTRLLLVIVLVTVALSACATSGYSASKLQRELRKSGATPAQARCVTDSLDNTIAGNKLGLHSEPTPDDVAAANVILAKCGIVTTTTSTATTTTVPPG